MLTIIAFLPIVLAIRFSEIQAFNDVHLFDTDDNGSVLLTGTDSGLVNIYVLKGKF